MSQLSVKANAVQSQLANANTAFTQDCWHSLKAIEPKKWQQEIAFLSQQV